MRKRRVRKADTTIRAIEDVVEPLKERHAVNEVESRTARSTDVADDEVDRVVRTAEGRIELWAEARMRHTYERSE